MQYLRDSMLNSFDSLNVMNTIRVPDLVQQILIKVWYMFYKLISILLDFWIWNPKFFFSLITWVLSVLSICNLSWKYNFWFSTRINSFHIRLYNLFSYRFGLTVFWGFISHKSQTAGPNLKSHVPILFYQSKYY